MSEPKDSMPKRQSAQKVSAFALATKSHAVSARIDIPDVLSFRPDWTEQQAGEFLREHCEAIGTAMVLRGVVMLASIIGEDRHVN